VSPSGSKQTSSGLLQDKSRRQDLYKQFVEEASTLYADALMHNEVEVSTLVSVYALTSRMRVISSPDIIEKADKVIRMIVNTYFLPNKTVTDLRDMMGSDALDPLRAFSEACREELGTLALT
jgi:hypothetical protein